MNDPWRKATSIFLGVLALYVGAYVALSFTGGYVLTQSGYVRYQGGGLSVSDIVQWQPRFGFCQRFRQTTGIQILRADTVGYIFAPLILIDQALIHKTHHLLDPQTGEPV